MSKRILQIVPAEGWLAIYREGKERLFAHRICCWAVVIDDGEVRVTGMDPGGDMVDFCEDSGNFDGYAHESGFGEVPSGYKSFPMREDSD